MVRKRFEAGSEGTLFGPEYGNLYFGCPVWIAEHNVMHAPLVILLGLVMDWLLPRQHAIEQALAKRHLSDASLVLADVTSTYLEGSHCPLAARGHSRDGKRGKLQIVFSLLCNRDGCPVAFQVFPGNTADPATVGPQLDTLRRR